MAYVKHDFKIYAEVRTTVLKERFDKFQDYSCEALDLKNLASENNTPVFSECCCCNIATCLFLDSAVVVT